VVSAAAGLGRAVTRLPSRGEVYLVDLDPTRGSAIRKTRPCLVVSPDELNHHLRTIIVAPMTTGGQPYPWRVPCRFKRKAGRVALDQVRTVDRERLVQRVGVLSAETLAEVLSTLGEMFSA
jgi:mRNA interferase MazF